MPDLNFTGERMIPGKVEPHLEFEHLSRYRFAARWVTDKRVIDLGCGVGYGVALLKEAGAQIVVGIDNSIEATFFAELAYGGVGVSFVTADCTRPCLQPAVAEVVTAFEIIPPRVAIRNTASSSSMCSRLTAFARLNSTPRDHTPGEQAWRTASKMDFQRSSMRHRSWRHQETPL